MNPHSQAKLFGLLAAAAIGGWFFPGCTESTTQDEIPDSTAVVVESSASKAEESSNPLVGKWVADGSMRTMIIGEIQREIPNEGNWMQFTDSTFEFGGDLKAKGTYTLSEDKKKVDLGLKGHSIEIIEIDAQKIKMMYYSEGIITAMTLKKE